MRTRTLAVALVSFASGAEQDDVPLIRLGAARSLRCVFTDSADSVFRDGQRSIGAESEKSAVQFENIDAAAGTVRAIGNVGGDLTCFGK